MTVEWTFKAYLAQRRATDTPQGDFTKDALADPSFPDSVKWRDVQGYLARKGAIPEAVKAAQSVFRQYLRGQGLRGGRPIKRGDP